MKGKVYLVGAGPGDPGLITVKAVELLREADVVIYDSLVSEKILKYARTGAELILMGKRGHEASSSQEEIEALMIRYAHEGRKIVRLKGGDPFVFGRGAEEAVALEKEDIPWEVVPGITSAIAVPSYAGIPVTYRESASSVAFITGHEDPRKGASNMDWAKISTGAGTLVFLMGFSNLSEIVEKLMENGQPPNKPCAVIMWGTLPIQKTVVGELSNIFGKVQEAKISAPSVFIVGDVVALREKLNWFEKRPLFGKRILVTRSRDQASTLVQTLEKLGAQPVEWPMIKIAEPVDWSSVDEEIRQLHTFHWIVFTSVNAVRIFLERLLSNSKDIRDLRGLKIAAMGEMTRRSLEERMLRVDLMPDQFLSENLLEEFRKISDLAGQKILLPRADLARPILSNGLKKMGAEVTELVLYQTLPDETSFNSSQIPAIFEKPMDWVTFASSSTVKNFVTALGDQFSKLKDSFKIASIGPVTSEEIKKSGLRIDVEAKVHTIGGLIEALLQYYASQNRSV